MRDPLLDAVRLGLIFLVGISCFGLLHPASFLEASMLVMVGGGSFWALVESERFR